MKTFLPYEDFAMSAEVLDDRRLARQRTDVVAILKKLLVPATEDDHPAVKMWRGSERVLCNYGLVICFEHQSRGNSGVTMEKINEYRSEFPLESDVKPEWLGDEAFHDSHKSYLLRSLPSHYRKYWPQTADELPLIWPRSPEKSPKDKMRRERERLIKRAHKLHDKAQKAIEEARTAATAAGLDPDTMEEIPEDDLEVISMDQPDADLLEL